MIRIDCTFILRVIIIYEERKRTMRLKAAVQLHGKSQITATASSTPHRATVILVDRCIAPAYH